MLQAKPGSEAATAANQATIRGEADLPNHLKGDGEGANEDGDEKPAARTAEDIPENKDQDYQLAYALNLLRGVAEAKSASASPN